MYSAHWIFIWKWIIDNYELARQCIQYDALFKQRNREFQGKNL